MRLFAKLYNIAFLWVILNSLSLDNSQTTLKNKNQDGCSQMSNSEDFALEEKWNTYIPTLELLYTILIESPLKRLFNYFYWEQDW